MKACWAGFFERLHQSDPPAVELDVSGVTIPISDVFFGYSASRTS